VTPDHVIFIPMVLLAGGFIGFIFGARAARNSFDLERKRDAERVAARAAREERKKARAAQPADGDDT